MTDIFSHRHLDAQLWTILEESDQTCRVYVYRIENGKPTRPAVWKGGPHPSLLNEIRQTCGSGQFQIMIRRGDKMLLCGEIGIAARIDRPYERWLLSPGRRNLG